MVNNNEFQKLEINPIGFVRSCYKQKFGTPRQSGLVPQSFAVIELLPEFQPQFSLQGLQDCSHIWVIFWFHKSENSRFHAKVHPPRLEGKTMGVFATRSPNRPNPLGLSLVKLEKIENNQLHISGVDFIEGTPIFDLKPYLVQTEAIVDAQSGWSQNSADLQLQVEWDLKAQKAIQDLDCGSLKDLIEGTLKRDPRPLVYRQNKPQYRDKHAIFVDNFDVHFKVLDDTRILVTDLIKI
jgi:tRNA-Thr(GGU) m(6)t(6)A37 methyltransferase TsaA